MKSVDKEKLITHCSRNVSSNFAEQLRSCLGDSKPGSIWMFHQFMASEISLFCVNDIATVSLNPKGFLVIAWALEDDDCIEITVDETGFCFNSKKHMEEYQFFLSSSDMYTLALHGGYSGSYDKWQQDYSIPDCGRDDDGLKQKVQYYIERRSGFKAHARVVCAANRLTDGYVLVGARHWDHEMHRQMDIYLQATGKDEAKLVDGEESGFIDQFGTFLTRQRAWKLAERNGQILNRCGGDTCDGGTLFSENLY